MPETLERAKYYRDKAEELRTIAQSYINDETMMTLARIARDYETMAERLESDAKVDEILRRQLPYIS
jgi:hypothetical protein